MPIHGGWISSTRCSRLASGVWLDKFNEVFSPVESDAILQIYHNPLQQCMKMRVVYSSEWIGAPIQCNAIGSRRDIPTLNIPALHRQPPQPERRTSSSKFSFEVKTPSPDESWLVLFEEAGGDCGGAVLNGAVVCKRWYRITGLRAICPIALHRTLCAFVLPSSGLFWALTSHPWRTGDHRVLRNQCGRLWNCSTDSTLS